MKFIFLEKQPKLLLVILIGVVVANIIGVIVYNVLNIDNWV